VELIGKEVYLKVKFVPKLGPLKTSRESKKVDASRVE
jgi:hypothetical protein